MGGLPPAARTQEQAVKQGPGLALELDADPYDPAEEDPAKSRALESSLWELQVSCASTPPPPRPRLPQGLP